MFQEFDFSDLENSTEYDGALNAKVLRRCIQYEKALGSRYCIGSGVEALCWEGNFFFEILSFCLTRSGTDSCHGFILQVGVDLPWLILKIFSP